MQVTLKNLGIIKHAVLDVGDLTIITGRNNTGKTYATYALYGFLRSWREAYQFWQYSRNLRGDLQELQLVTVELEQVFNSAMHFLDAACEYFSGGLAGLFAAEEKTFEGAAFKLSLGDAKPDISEAYSSSNGIYTASREKGSSTINLTLGKEALASGLKQSPQITRMLAEILADSCLGGLLPRPVILSSERTGISLFWRELDIQKNVLTDRLKNLRGNEKLDVHKLVHEMAARYARPIQDNIDTTRDFPLLMKQESFLVSQHPDVLVAFAALAGGGYKVGAGKELHFAPAGNGKRKGSIPIYLGSSSVRALMGLGLYLQHQAQPGDLLMIDEPELNLHPEGQRSLGRVLARLVNAGVKVFLTTHSDYLVREVNSLIRLGDELPEKPRLLKKLGYAEAECLSPDQVKLYVANDGSLEPVEVTTDGFSRSTFDTVLEAMNRVEDALMLAKEEVAHA